METVMTEKSTIRTVRFHEYGEPADVLRLETAPVPAPGPGRVRILVHACGLNPADCALCRGLSAPAAPSPPEPPAGPAPRPPARGTGPSWTTGRQCRRDSIPRRRPRCRWRW